MFLLSLPIQEVYKRFHNNYQIKLSKTVKETILVDNKGNNWRAGRFFIEYTIKKKNIFLIIDTDN